MTLREIFQSEPKARKAREAKVRELQADEGELSFDLAGDAEAPIQVEGVGPDAIEIALPSAFITSGTMPAAAVRQRRLKQSLAKTQK